MKNMAKRAAALLLTVAVVLTLCACGTTQTQTSTESTAEQTSSSEASGGEKVINRGIIGAPGSLNPLVDAGGAQFIVLEMVYDRLFDIDADNNLMPRLCDSYETNDDFTEYTVHINENAKWTDGTDVTAEDIVWTYEMYTDPEVGTTHAAKLAKLKGVDPTTGLRVEGETFGVTAIDENTVRFELATSCFPWDLFNAYLYAFPKHVYGAVDPSTLLTSDLWLNPVGSGYCILDAYIDGSTYEFTANKDYYLGAPDFDRMVIKCMDQTNLLSALMSNEVDMVVGHPGRGNIPTVDVAVAKEADNLTMESGGYTIRYIAINNEKFSKDVRKAIDLAVDKEMIVNNVLQGYGEVLNQLCPPSSLHYDDSLADWSRDVETAKQLLKDAGWDESQTVELLVSSSDAEQQQMAVIIQQNLAEIGMNVEIKSMEYTSLLDQCRGTSDGSFDLAIVGTAFAAEWAGFKANFVPKGATNFTYSDDDTLFNLLTAASEEIDFDKRHELLCEVQEYMVDEMPYVYLVNQQSVFCYNNEVVTKCDLSNVNNMVWRMWE